MIIQANGGRLLLNFDDDRTHPGTLRLLPMGVLDVFQRNDCFDRDRNFAGLEQVEKRFEVGYEGLRVATEAG